MSDFNVNETYDKVRREIDFGVGKIMLENQDSQSTKLHMTTH